MTVLWLWNMSCKKTSGIDKKLTRTVSLIDLYQFWKIFGLFWQRFSTTLRKHTRYFYFQKQAQQFWKPPQTYFQTCGQFKSRLEAKSQSRGPQIEKIWRGVRRVSRSIVLEWKRNEWLRCKENVYQLVEGEGWIFNASDWHL